MGLSLAVYNIGLFIGLVVLAPLWLGYLIAVKKTRAGFWEKLGFWSLSLTNKLKISDFSKQRIWFHAVSVGEFNAIRSLIVALEPHYDLIISTTTKTGHQLACKTFPQLPIVYFPFDIPWVLSGVLQRIKPDLVVVMETELWPNFAHAVIQFKKPLILMNGRLSQRSYKGYLSVQWFMKSCLQQFTHFYMQTQADLERIQTLGQLSSKRLSVMGNLKFDLWPSIDASKQAALLNLFNIQKNDTVLSFASTHSGEDTLFLESFLQLKKDFPLLKLILAPRHPERLPEICNILNHQAVRYSVRSQLTPEQPNQTDIIILDSIGELLTIYNFSTIAVMGGSFVEKGGQNPLEPLSQGVPVIVGPHMENFFEISRLILENEAGFQVNQKEALVQAIKQLLTQPEIYASMVKNGQQLLANNRGAKDRIVQAIQQYLPIHHEKI